MQRFTAKKAASAARSLTIISKWDTKMEPRRWNSVQQTTASTTFTYPHSNCPFLFVVNHKVTTHNPTSSTQ